MLRTVEARAERQEELRERNAAGERPADSLTLVECARELNVSLSTARRIFRHEPGVETFRTPGSTRPLIRVPRAVLDRVRRRSAILPDFKRA